MGYDCNGASGGLEIPVSVSNPWSCSMWFRGTSSYDYVFGMADSVAGHYVAGQLRGSGGEIRLSCVAAANEHVETGNGHTKGEWANVIIISTADDDRVLVLDGDWANRAISTTSVTPTINYFAMGKRRDGADSGGLPGDVGEGAVWDVALTEAECVALSKRYSPLLVRPGSLHRYVPAVRVWQDLIAASSITDYSTGAATDHPPMIYPSRPQIVTAPVAAPAGGIIPQVMHHRRLMGVS